jgi:hypothetical protein
MKARNKATNKEGGEICQRHQCPDERRTCCGGDDGATKEQQEPDEGDNGRKVPDENDRDRAPHREDAAGGLDWSEMTTCPRLGLLT